MDRQLVGRSRFRCRVSDRRRRMDDGGDHRAGLDVLVRGQPESQHELRLSGPGAQRRRFGGEQRGDPKDGPGGAFASASGTHRGTVAAPLAGQLGRRGRVRRLLPDRQRRMGRHLGVPQEPGPGLHLDRHRTDGPELLLRDVRLHRQRENLQSRQRRRRGRPFSARDSPGGGRVRRRFHRRERQLARQLRQRGRLQGAAPAARRGRISRRLDQYGRQRRHRLDNRDRSGRERNLRVSGHLLLPANRYGRSQPLEKLDLHDPNAASGADRAIRPGPVHQRGTGMDRQRGS